MALTIFGFRDRPHDFAVTKVDAPLEECVFLLDFARPLERLRWLGKFNRWLGPTIALFVPVVHQSETSGGYVVGIRRGQPYFVDILKLWKTHYRAPRTLAAQSIDGLDLIADFANHFPEDCN